jgi:hypothetical protein
MELLHNSIEDETVGPSISRASRRRPALRFKWTDVQARLERRMLGRLLLDGMRWGVVAGLIVIGYVTAAGINTGVTALRDAGAATNAQQLLAASAAHK